MSGSTESTEQDLLPRAKAGDRAAFGALAEPHLPMLRSLIRRMIGDPDDTNDLVQDTLLGAFTKVVSFRGDAKFSTWLCTIGTRLAIDHLRRRKRWRLRAQSYSKQESHQDPAKGAEVARIINDPSHRFDAHEHIAFCFTCVGRTLEPSGQAALVLRDVMGYSNREAAQAVGVSESVFRHELSAARKHMIAQFDDLCALVSKRGACWQCKGLREIHPVAGRGPQVPSLDDPGSERELKYRKRLQVVRDADVDRGHAQAFHDLIWHRIAHNEQTDYEPATD